MRKIGRVLWAMWGLQALVACGGVEPRGVFERREKGVLEALAVWDDVVVKRVEGEFCRATSWWRLSGERLGEGQIDEMRCEVRSRVVGGRGMGPWGERDRCELRIGGVWVKCPSRETMYGLWGAGSYRLVVGGDWALVGWENWSWWMTYRRVR